MTKKHHHTSHSENAKEDWMNSKWRPMMGWMYMTVCMCDFIIFPVLWSLLQSMSKGAVTSQWQPLTLQGAGLFHIAMGGVLGLAAYGRTQEKLNGANNGGIQLPSNAGTTYVQSTNSGVPNGNSTTTATGFATSPTAFGYAPTAGFGSPGSFGSPTNRFGDAGVGAPAVTWPTVSSAPATVTTGWGGKKAPPEPVFPEL
jgi:hypothetical protein